MSLKIVSFGARYYLQIIAVLLLFILILSIRQEGLENKAIPTESLIHTTISDIKKIEVTTKDTRYVLERLNQQWFVTAPDYYRADDMYIINLLTAIKDSNIDFTIPIGNSNNNNNFPNNLTVSYTNNTSISIYFSELTKVDNSEDNFLLAKRIDSEFISLLDANIYYLLPYSKKQTMSRVLYDYQIDNILQITISSDGNERVRFFNNGENLLLNGIIYKSSENSNNLSLLLNPVAKSIYSVNGLFPKSCRDEISINFSSQNGDTRVSSFCKDRYDNYYTRIGKNVYKFDEFHFEKLFALMQYN